MSKRSKKFQRIFVMETEPCPPETTREEGLKANRQWAIDTFIPLLDHVNFPFVWFTHGVLNDLQEVLEEIRNAGYIIVATEETPHFTTIEIDKKK